MYNNDVRNYPVSSVNSLVTASPVSEKQKLCLARQLMVVKRKYTWLNDHHKDLITTDQSVYLKTINDRKAVLQLVTSVIKGKEQYSPESVTDIISSLDQELSQDLTQVDSKYLKILQKGLVPNFRSYGVAERYIKELREAKKELTNAINKIGETIKKDHYMNKYNQLYLDNIEESLKNLYALPLLEMYQRVIDVGVWVRQALCHMLEIEHEIKNPETECLPDNKSEMKAQVAAVSSAAQVAAVSSAAQVAAVSSAAQVVIGKPKTYKVDYLAPSQIAPSQIGDIFELEIIRTPLPIRTIDVNYKSSGSFYKDKMNIVKGQSSPHSAATGAADFFVSQGKPDLYQEMLKKYWDAHGTSVKILCRQLTNLQESEAQENSGKSTLANKVMTKAELTVSDQYPTSTIPPAGFILVDPSTAYPFSQPPPPGTKFNCYLRSIVLALFGCDRKNLFIDYLASATRTQLNKQGYTHKDEAVEGGCLKTLRKAASIIEDNIGVKVNIIELMSSCNGHLVTGSSHDLDEHRLPVFILLTHSPNTSMGHYYAVVPEGWGC